MLLSHQSACSGRFLGIRSLATLRFLIQTPWAPSDAFGTLPVVRVWAIIVRWREKSREVLGEEEGGEGEERDACESFGEFGGCLSEPGAEAESELGG